MNKSVIFLVNLILLAVCLSKQSVYISGVLDRLIELNQAVGKDNNEVGVLVAQVSSSLAKSHEKFVSFHLNQSNNCKSGADLLEGFIKKLTNDKLTAVADANSAETDNKLVTTELEHHKKELEATRNALVEQKKLIGIEIENFRNSASEAEQKIVVIKTLRDIVTDELLNPTGGKSFIQVEKFNDKIRELQSLLSGSRSVYAPLTTTLLELALAKGFSDQNILRQIIEVLDKLARNLKEFREKQEAEGKQSIKEMKNQAKEKLAQLKNLKKMVVEAQSRFTSNESIVKHCHEEEANLTNVVNRKNNELRNWQNVCSSEEALNKRETEEREKVVHKIGEVSNDVNNLK